MNKNRSSLLAWLLAAACFVVSIVQWLWPDAPKIAQAQTQNQVLQVLYTARTTATTYATSTVIRNIGQAFHQVHVVMTDSGGVCSLATPGQTVIRLYASHEPISSFATAHLFRIGNSLVEFSGYLPVNPGPAAPAASATNRGQGYIYATGVYRDIRLVIENIPANCAASAWYSGSIQGDLNPALVAANGGYLNGTFVVAINAAAIGSNTVIAGVTNAGSTCCQIAIDDLTVYNTLLQDVTISLGGSTWYSFPAWAAGCALLREKTPGVPKVLGAIGGAFTINLTAGQVTGEVTYHYE